MSDFKHDAEAICFDFQGDFGKTIHNPVGYPNMSWTMAKKCALKEVTRRLTELRADLEKHTDIIYIHNFLIGKIRYWEKIEIEIKQFN